MIVQPLFKIGDLVLWTQNPLKPRPKIDLHGYFLPGLTWFGIVMEEYNPTSHWPSGKIRRWPFPPAYEVFVQGETYLIEKDALFVHAVKYNG